MKEPDIVYWNYRVVKDKDGFSFREVFYNSKNETLGWSNEPCHAYGEDEEDFSEELKLMAEALERPFLATKRGKLVEYKRPKVA